MTALAESLGSSANIHACARGSLNCARHETNDSDCSFSIQSPGSCLAGSFGDPFRFACINIGETEPKVSLVRELGPIAISIAIAIAIQLRLRIESREFILCDSNNDDYSPFDSVVYFLFFGSSFFRFFSLLLVQFQTAQQYT